MIGNCPTRSPKGEGNYNAKMTLSDLLKSSADNNAGKTALIFGERTWSYSELYRATLAAASGFSRAGIKEGDRVAIFSKNCPEFVITVFGLGHIGACAVPVNFLLKAEELLFICSDAGVNAVVTQRAFLETIE